jgi:hypothetical protein
MDEEKRPLIAKEGRPLRAFPSIYAWCTEAFHLSEAEAYLRIAVARASREHPVILPMLGDGRLHLSGMAPHLTRENRDELLRRATHRSKREIEELIAEVAPREDVPALMRRLPGAKADARGRARGFAVEQPSTPSRMGGTVTPSPIQLEEGRQSLTPASSAPERARPLPPPVVQPLAPGRYGVQFTAGRGAMARFRRSGERVHGGAAIASAGTGGSSTANPWRRGAGSVRAAPLGS